MLYLCNMEKYGTLEITDKERDLIFKGIRPEDMPRDIFRQVRKEMRARTRNYLRGTYAWVSKHIVIKTAEELEKEGFGSEGSNGEISLHTDIGRGTYRRTSERRHKRLGRK